MQALYIIEIMLVGRTRESTHRMNMDFDVSIVISDEGKCRSLVFLGSILLQPSWTMNHG